MADVMQVLTAAQVRFARIINDISAECVKLCGATDQVVEALALPEGTASTHLAINFGRGEMLPRFALPLHIHMTGELNKQMDMVRHHHEITQLVSVTIE